MKLRLKPNVLFARAGTLIDEDTNKYAKIITDDGPNVKYEYTGPLLDDPETGFKYFLTAGGEKHLVADNDFEFRDKATKYGTFYDAELAGAPFKVIIQNNEIVEAWFRDLHFTN